LLAVNTVWSVIYDTLYAMVDREDDLSVGIKSTAILFGKKDILIIGLLMVVMIAMLLSIGIRHALSWPWFLATAISGCLFCWQIFSIRGRERGACFKAFLNNNWVGLALFLGLFCHYVISGTYT